MNWIKNICVTLVVLLNILGSLNTWSFEDNWEQRSTFIGQIHATHKYPKFLSKSKVIYTVDQDAIQRVIYESGTEYTGITFYPFQKVVLLFRRDHSKKVYTQITFVEYLDYIKALRHKTKLEDYEQFGFSTYFHGITSKIKTESQEVEYDNHPCHQYQIEQISLVAKEQFKIIHCQHLGIPRAWLSLTDIAIPDKVTGFPFKVTFEVNDEEKVANQDIPTSILDQTLEFAGKALDSVNRFSAEWYEFTFKVNKIERGHVYKAFLFQRGGGFIESGFIRVDSIDALSRSFPDHPSVSQENSWFKWDWDD